VNNIYNNGYDYPKQGQDKEYFEKILCDPGILQSTHMLSGSNYVEKAGTTN
jgi:hypothetical protein